jgi:hypothetical protein
MSVLAAVMDDKKLVLESGKENGPGKSGEGGEDGEGGSDAANEVERNVSRMERDGGGEGHESSDEDELADDADATDARKKARQGVRDIT